MKFFSTLTLGIIASLFVACSKDDDKKEESYTDIHSFVETLDYQGTIIVNKNGQDLLRSGYGFANSSTKENNDTDTKFRLASVSKTFTGMAMVQLKRDGLIDSYDQTLSDFDESFPMGDQITVRHLLSHRSGIPNYQTTLEPYAIAGQHFDKDEIYEVIKTSVNEEGLLFTPGESISYSNSNFLIAAILVEELTNKTFDDYLQQQLFQPLQMNGTELGTDIIPTTGYAQGYNKGENVSHYPMHLAFGAGQYTSSAEDMEKWCLAILGNQWYTESEKEAIFYVTPEEEYTDFGLAWFVSNMKGKTVYWHGGDLNGFSTLIAVIPSSNSYIIALSNAQDDLAEKRNAILEEIIANEL